MEQDIIGGVSPLKARQASRGGKRAGQATATSRRRGGFAKARGKRGAGGANVGGYNVRTRFTPVAPSGGTTTFPSIKSPDPKPPITVDDKGKPTVNKPEGWKEYVPGTEDKEGRYETETKTWEYGGGARESWEQAWERKKKQYTTTGQKSRMGTDENEYNVFKNIDEYIDYMKRVKEYNKTEEGKAWSKIHRKSSKEKKTHTSTTTKYIKGEPGKPGYWLHYNAKGEVIKKEEGGPDLYDK